MSVEMWLIAAVRLLGAAPVLRWPLAGVLIALAVDQSDLFMMNLIDLGGVDDYQTFDKYLDQAYLLTFLIVALRWEGPARSVAIALYAYRLIGFVAFEVSQERDVLLFFPNFFEFWVVLFAALKQVGRDPFASPKNAELADQSRHTPTARPGAFSPASRVEGVSLKPARRLASTTFGAILLVLVALKLFQEYALHYGRWLDGFTAVEAVETIWRWLTPPY